MVRSLKLTRLGNSTGVVLPKDALERLQLSKGDRVFVIDTPRGLELTPYDPEVEKQMTIAEQIMREDREVLRKLAE